MTDDTTGKESKKSWTSFYVRMNGDNEKDYAFALPSDEPVTRLYDIFTSLPVVLSPHYFRDPIPKGFAVSVHPGVLTAEGCVLFSAEADEDKWLERISDNAKIGDVIGTDMLVVPLFPWNTRRQMTVLTVLFTWLYLDLPQHITPTPGVAPLLVLTRFLMNLFPTIVGKDLEDIKIFNSPWWGWGFFFIHCVKVSFIYLLFRVGIINPRSFNPRKNREGPQVSSLSPEKLRELGWMGSKRAAPEEYSQKHRDFVINKLGGVLGAHRAGLFDQRDVLPLQAGEGWNVWAKNVSPELRKAGPDFLNSEGKFIVSDRYQECLSEHAKKQWTELSGKNDELELFSKNLMRYGFLEGPEKLKSLYKELYSERFPDSKKNQRI